MNTGENVEALRKIIDLIRKCSIFLLFLHCYFYCYAAFEAWQLTHELSEKILRNLARTGLFQYFWFSKSIALGLLLVSLIGVKGKKNEKLKAGTALRQVLAGLFLFTASQFLLELRASFEVLAGLYMAVTSIGYLFILAGGARLSRLIRNRLDKDIFNKLQETFPQEERLLENEFSFNLPARYKLKGKIRNSYVSFVSPFRSILTVGNPGSGKSRYVINPIIKQAIRKAYTAFIYDYKFDDLSIIAYNTFLKYKHHYPVEPKFYVINFEDISLSHRCNPLDPQSMTDITDATESSRTIMLGLNRQWIAKSGDFFVESPINFLTAIIWFLRKYKNGKYCTLPHCIELMQVNYDQLFPVLRTEPEIEVLIG